jgi:hypothetical protein
MIYTKIPLKAPKSQPSRLWFLARGYKQADTRHTSGEIVWLHPKTNDVLSKYGTKLSLQIVPKERHMKTTAQYLKLPRGFGDMLLARLKYLTFKGEIPEGYTIDHIDGNTLNNDILNLRAIPDAINRRDGGFLKKLRNNHFVVAVHPTVVILKGYENMARWKAEHTEWQYRQLRDKDLLRVFFGPKFTVLDIDPMDLDFAGHPEF